MDAPLRDLDDAVRSSRNGGSRVADISKEVAMPTALLSEALMVIDAWEFEGAETQTELAERLHR